MSTVCLWLNLRYFFLNKFFNRNIFEYGQNCANRFYKETNQKLSYQIVNHTKNEKLQCKQII